MPPPRVQGFVTAGQALDSALGGLLRPNEQPYFQAYRVFRGERGELRAGHEYLTWIRGKWAEWRAERGVGPDQPLSEEQRDDFGAWLRASVGIPESVE